MPGYTIGKHRGKYVLATRGNDGRRLRISLGTDDLGLAEARARDIWTARTAPRSDRLEELWPAYERERRLAGVDTERFISAWKALAPHFSYRLGRAISRENCRDYYLTRKQEGRADSTIKTELELLRACLRHHFGNAAPALWIPPASAPRGHYLTKAEAEAFLNELQTPHVNLFVVLALCTGARMSAILDLTWDRIDFERGIIDLNPPGRHKTNKRRTVVPMNNRARAALAEAYRARQSEFVVEHCGKQIASIKRSIRMASIRTGIQCSPHVFRHTAGVWMAEADVPMAKIAQYLGHTNTRVTEAVYARYSPSFMQDASAALEW